jgi:hypothetical protein
MMSRTIAVWFLLLLAAVLNGGVREKWIIPRVGQAQGHLISTLMLAMLVLLIAWLTARWLNPRTPSDAFAVGLLWLGLTLAFEFLAGHYLFHRSWSSLRAEYDVSKGRIWVLVPIVTSFAPLLAGYVRRLYR